MYLTLGHITPPRTGRRQKKRKCPQAQLLPHFLLHKENKLCFSTSQGFSYHLPNKTLTDPVFVNSVYVMLEISLTQDGEAWWAAVYGVAQSRTRLKRLSSSSSMVVWAYLRFGRTSITQSVLVCPASMTKDQRLGSLNSKNIFSHSLGD